MTIRWLKHVKDGTVYEWDEELAKHELCTEVSEEEAFPEKFIPKKQKSRKSKLDLSTDKEAVAESSI